MSRLLLWVFVMTLGQISLASAAAALQLSEEEVADLIAAQKKLVTIDRNGCIVDPNDDGTTIVVCGDSEEDQRNRIPGSGPVDNDRIRRGEAISTRRAGEKDNRACGVIGTGLGCTELPQNWIKGNYSPPYPPDFKDVIAGLPEPDQVVAEGSNQDPKAPPE